MRNTLNSHCMGIKLKTECLFECQYFTSCPNTKIQTYTHTHVYTQTHKYMCTCTHTYAYTINMYAHTHAHHTGQLPFYLLHTKLADNGFPVVFLFVGIPQQ